MVQRRGNIPLKRETRQLKSSPARKAKSAPMSWPGPDTNTKIPLSQVSILISASSKKKRQHIDRRSGCVEPVMAGRERQNRSMSYTFAEALVQRARGPVAAVIAKDCGKRAARAQRSPITCNRLHISAVVKEAMLVDRGSRKFRMGEELAERFAGR